MRKIIILCLWLGVLSGLGATVCYSDSLAKAAKSGNAQAQWELGYAYNEGVGIEQSYDEAIVWYVKSAKQGNAEAQFALGRLYYRGFGVGQDYAKAVKYLRPAAEQKHAWALWFMGDAYVNGYGYPKDDEKAFASYLLAAEQRLADAQYIAGTMYYEGKGVSKDLVRAYAWITNAMNYAREVDYSVYSDYQTTQMEVEINMTPEQLEQANALLSSWGDNYKARE